MLQVQIRMFVTLDREYWQAGVLRPFNLNWLLALLDLGKRYIIAGDET